MTIAIFGNSINRDHIGYLTSLFAQLAKYEVKILVHHDFLQHLANVHQYKPSVYGTYKQTSDIAGIANFMLSLGGDGTFLDSTLFTRNTNIPVMGINFGSLGFLANISLQEMNHAIDLLLQNRFRVEKRSTIEVVSEDHLFDPFPFGLNDFTVQKGSGSSMLHVDTYIDDEFLCTYHADGLIISTPTGSTAYSLSVGGPILNPNISAFVISTIAPHNLTFRPLVISDNSTIHFEVESRAKEAMLTLDSRNITCQTPLKISVKKSNFNINIVSIEDSSFYRTLRGKMLWGVDKRN